MTRVTVDASVVLAWLLDEPRPPWVDETIAAARAERQLLVAPPLIWMEIGNRLARARGVREEFALEAMIRAEALGVESVELDRPDPAQSPTARPRARACRCTTPPTWRSRRQRALPCSHSTSVWSKLPGPWVLGQRAATSRVSERPGPYGLGPVDQTSIAAIGAALAEMRREYSR